LITRSLPVQWTLHPRHQPERGLALARDLGAPPAVGLALVNRGIDDLEAARRFLDPALEDLHEPAGLCDLGVAVERIRRAIADGERLLVHGDYDVDGITATFLVYAVLRDLGAQVEYRIPHRTRDGYGLTEAGVDEARRRGCGLIVTVDCGVTAVEAVIHARTLGIDVVVTDHHEPPAVLPPALAVVDPLRPDCSYPFKSLAGVGVAFKLAEALLRGRGGIERAREYLDVVALGTIADVVPLVGENRVLARLGLDLLNRTQRPGLRAMIDVAGLGGRRLASSHVAFVIAPRINAAGRMGHAEQGLRLLLAPDEREGRAYAESLDEDNARRRQEDERALVEAEQRVRTELGWPDCSSIVLWSEGWHPGVIGIVASRLVERFQRPTILVALDGERGRGSGRSLAAVDLHRTLERMSDLLESHGGHALAAGLSVRRERLPELRRRFEALVREQAGPEDFVKRLTLDGDLALRDCDLDLIEWLDRLSPHGLENPEPLFRAHDVEVESCSAVRNGHLKLRLRDGTGTADAIGFGMGALAPELPRGRRCEVAFVPSANEWMGETRVQLKLKGVRPS
jgi:single-stranded-DNA-specific exonuclease